MEFLGRVCKPFVLSYGDLGAATGLISYWLWILIFILIITWTSDWMGGPLPCVYLSHVFFLSFKQFARCLCSISTLGAEHSSHWGSWPLVSRGLVKKTFLGWEMKSKALGEAWFLGVARVLFEGLSLRVSVVDIILHLYWKPSHLPGTRITWFSK